MAIWFRDYTPEELNHIVADTLITHVGIEFVEIGEDFLQLGVILDYGEYQLNFVVKCC